MITLQFVQASGIESKAIELFEHGWCSHVDCVMPDGALVGARSDIIGGAKAAGVQTRTPNYEPWSKVQQVGIIMTEGQEKEFYNFLAKQLGKPYDTTAIVAFALDRNWREDDSWFCSELMAAAIEASGWFVRPLSNGVNKITPSDLLLVLSPWNALTSN